ncbi:MAG: sensor histidine kinase [Flaviaesturariibacter sp.]|nr:sensor histidine kinase [Flaviaesturariibacter sp.]
MDARQAQIYTAVLIAGAVIFCIIVFFVVSVVKQQRRNLHLQQQNLMTEMNTLERERTRMAADLHDDLGPTLSFIKFQVDSIESANPDDLALLQNAGARLDDAVKKIRSIAHDLMPSSLSRKGLSYALQELVALLNRTTPLQIDLYLPPELVLEKEQSIAVFRMLQEVIQNTLKHAGAKRLALQLTLEADTLQILCEDDGTGFHYNDSQTDAPGLGLRNLHSRVGIIGGRVKISSETGKGTQYLFSIPLSINTP